MYAKATTFVIEGLGARRVTVEVDIRPGLPAFSVAGVTDRDARDLRERVRAAILNEGFDFPQFRVVVNLTGASLPVASCSIDLAVAVALLCASDQLDPSALERAAFVGELSLDGSVRAVRGVLPIAEAAAADGVTTLVVPWHNAGEAALGAAGAVAPVERLSELLAVADGVRTPVPCPELTPNGGFVQDLRDLRGHAFAIRALEISAAGGHHLLLIGRPGCGKTMLARRFPSILPAMSESEALEVTRMQSIAGSLPVDGLAQRRPYVSPSYTISASALVGLAAQLLPGEASLASRGVLFLDEIAEFSSRTLDSLREPLDTGHVVLSRKQQAETLPAHFTLVGATCACPCGFDPDACECSPFDITRYARRLSHPIFDRFDLQCQVQRPTTEEVDAGPVTDSTTVRARVERARLLQRLRYANTPFECNAQLDASSTQRLLRVPEPAQTILSSAYQSGRLSLRSYDRTLRVARTIADLDDRSVINSADISEALTFCASSKTVGIAA